jgi:hypothetical protein
VISKFIANRVAVVPFTVVVPVTTPAIAGSAATS